MISIITLVLSQFTYYLLGQLPSFVWNYLLFYRIFVFLLVRSVLLQLTLILPIAGFAHSVVQCNKCLFFQADLLIYQGWGWKIELGIAQTSLLFDYSFAQTIDLGLKRYGLKGTLSDDLLFHFYLLMIMIKVFKNIRVSVHLLSLQLSWTPCSLKWTLYCVLGLLFELSLHSSWFEDFAFFVADTLNSHLSTLICCINAFCLFLELHLCCNSISDDSHIDRL